MFPRRSSSPSWGGSRTVGAPPGSSRSVSPGPASSWVVWGWRRAMRMLLGIVLLAGLGSAAFHPIASIVGGASVGHPARLRDVALLDRGKRRFRGRAGARGLAAALGRLAGDAGPDRSGVPDGGRLHRVRAGYRRRDRGGEPAGVPPPRPVAPAEPPLCAHHLPVVGIRRPHRVHSALAACSGRIDGRGGAGALRVSVRRSGGGPGGRDPVGSCGAPAGGGALAGRLSRPDGVGLADPRARCAGAPWPAPGWC